MNKQELIEYISHQENINKDNKLKLEDFNKTLSYIDENFPTKDVVQNAVEYGYNARASEMSESRPRAVL